MPLRLFVAVWPSPEVAGVLERHPRPVEPGVRWTTPPQWHVTLRFLGRVEEERVDDLADALVAALRGQPPVDAVLGPATRRLGRSVLAVPVRGLDELAAVTHDATAGIVPVVEDRPFRGHLTLARARRGAAVPSPLVGVPLAGSWVVRSVHLVRSTLRSTGAVYEDVASVALGAEGA